MEFQVVFDFGVRNSYFGFHENSESKIRMAGVSHEWVTLAIQ
jgi:hypothetical protein